MSNTDIRAAEYIGSIILLLFLLVELEFVWGGNLTGNESEDDSSASKLWIYRLKCKGLSQANAYREAGIGVASERLRNLSTCCKL